MSGYFEPLIKSQETPIQESPALGRDPWAKGDRWAAGVDQIPGAPLQVNRNWVVRGPGLLMTEEYRRNNPPPYRF